MPPLATSSDVQSRSLMAAARAMWLNAGGRPHEALAAAERAWQSQELLGPAHDAAKWGFVEDGGSAHRAFPGHLGSSLASRNSVASSQHTKALIAQKKKHPQEALTLLSHALSVALDNDIPSAALRAYFNRADALVQRDRYAEALEAYRNCLVMAPKIGDRMQERSVTAETIWVRALTGDWEEAWKIAAEIPEAELTEGANEYLSLLSAYAVICTNRGQQTVLEGMLRRVERFADSADVQERGTYLTARAAWLRSVGDCDEALATARSCLDIIDAFGSTHQIVKLAFIEGVEAALALNDWRAAGQMLTMIEDLGTGERAPLLNAHAARFRARFAASLGEEAGVEAAFISATEQLRALSSRFWMAASETEHAEWLALRGHPAAAQKLAEGALDVFVSLQAQPWIERSRRLLPLEAAAS